MSWRYTLLFFVAVIVLAGAEFLPGSATPWPLWAIALLVVVTVALFALLILMWLPVGPMILVGVGMWNLVPQVRGAFHSHGHPVVQILLALAAGLLGSAGVYCDLAIPRVRIRRPFNRGDYDAALEMVEILLKKSPKSVTWCAFRCSILIQAGRLDEAERKAREMAGPKFVKARVPWAALGQIECLKGNFGEARQYFNEAFARGSLAAPRVYLAEAMLEEGREPDQALELVARACGSRWAPFSSNLFDPVQPALSGADRAWAFALLERSAEAEFALAQAAVRVPRSVPLQAAFLYRSGRARLALGTPALAMRDFARAAQVDPKGLWGMRSAGWLAQLERAPVPAISHSG